MKNKLSDYHIHTKYSTDSDELAENIINSAIHKGLAEICFTDHIDYDYPSTDENGNPEFVFNIPDYLNEYEPLRQKYEREIKVKIGVELGLMDSVLSKNELTAANYPFDFIIGSSHLLDGEDPYYPEYWANKTPDSVLEHYFLTTLKNVSSYNNYDIYGHLDYIVRYIPDKSYIYNHKKYMDIIDEILRKIIYNGHGIEINTSSLAKGLSKPNPCIDIVRHYKSLGGEIITLGSDAHIAENVAFGFEKMRDILLDCGFKYYTTFTARKAEFNKLD